MPGLIGMYEFEELYPSRFIRAVDLKGQELTVTIKGIRMEELTSKSGKRLKPILALHECAQELVLNRTNGEAIKAMFGRNTAAWIGRRVTVYPAPYEGSVALRVKGSPDIEETTEIIIELPGKPPFAATMHRTPLLVVATSSRRVDEGAAAQARSLVREVGAARAAGGT
jgi:hypothetical protein